MESLVEDNDLNIWIRKSKKSNSDSEIKIKSNPTRNMKHDLLVLLKLITH